FQPGTFTSTYTVSHEAVITLGDPTISLDISGPTVAAAGSQASFSIRVSGDSLASQNLDTTMLALTMPAALSAASFTPAPAEEGKTSWPLSQLAKKGDAYELSFTAEINAQSGETAVLKAALVSGQSQELLVSGQHEISIQHASVSVSVTATPASGQKLQWGERVDYAITLKNTGTYVMRNVVVRMQLPDESLWQSGSLSAHNGGFYEGGSVFWDAENTASLDSLRPEGQASLSLSLTVAERPPRGFAGIPRMIAGVEATASLGDQEVSVSSEESVTNILTDIEFNIQGLYTSPEGAVLGSGPHPPQQGQKTVYVIKWNIGPTTSGLRDLVLSARLPSYVSWEDDTSLNVGEISFDASSRMVTWRASRVPALDLPISVQFKVSVTPVSGLGNDGLLVERSEFRVVDDAAGEAMELFLNGVTVGSIE
ncbi:MAG: hypothetical protein U1C18_00855, partial [Patescibacteria group bacterium]|nr:hypothetical protein [Patescibacteria group bacterium]